MDKLDTAQLIALAATLGWASGIRLYAVLFVVGLVGFLGWFPLPHGLQILSHPIVLGASGLMLGVEFLADKIPAIDSLWDLVHTFIRIPAGAAIAASVFGDSAAPLTFAAALMGGTLAAGSHFTKAGGRMLINTSPEPFSNWAASFGEDLMIGTLLFLAFTHPIPAAILLTLLVLIMVWLLPKLWRFIKAMIARLLSWFGHAQAVDRSRQR